MKLKYIILCWLAISCSENKNCVEKDFNKETFSKIISQNLRTFKNEMSANILDHNKIEEQTSISYYSGKPKTKPEFVLNIEQNKNLAICNILSTAQNHFVLPVSNGDSIEVLLTCFAMPKLRQIDEFWTFFKDNMEIRFAERKNTRIFIIENLMYFLVIKSEEIDLIDTFFKQIKQIVLNDYKNYMKIKFGDCIPESIIIKEVYKPKG